MTDPIPIETTVYRCPLCGRDFLALGDYRDHELGCNDRCSIEAMALKESCVRIRGTSTLGIVRDHMGRRVRLDTIHLEHLTKCFCISFPEIWVDKDDVEIIDKVSAEADVDSFLNDARIRAINIISRAVP